MHNLAQAAVTIEDLLQQVARDSGFQIVFDVAIQRAAPNLRISFHGPDTPLMTGDGGALLRALEHLCVAALALDRVDRPRIQFDLANVEGLRFADYHRAHMPEFAASPLDSSASMWQDLVFSSGQDDGLDD